MNYLEPIRSRQEGTLALEFTGLIAATRSVITMNYLQFHTNILPELGKPLTGRKYIELIKSLDGQDRKFVFRLIPDLRIYLNSNEALSLVQILDQLSNLLNQNEESLIEQIVKAKIKEYNLSKPEPGSFGWKQL